MQTSRRQIPMLKVANFRTVTASYRTAQSRRSQFSGYLFKFVEILRVDAESCMSSFPDFIVLWLSRPRFQQRSSANLVPAAYAACLYCRAGPSPGSRFGVFLRVAGLMLTIILNAA